MCIIIATDFAEYILPTPKSDSSGTEKVHALF